VSKAVTVNGSRLVVDRVAAGMTIDQLLDKISECGDSQETFSKRTYSRAVNSDNIRHDLLGRIAAALGFPVERYIKDSHLEPFGNCDLNGLWGGFYIEPDMSGIPNLVDVTLSCEQSGTSICIGFISVDSHGSAVEDVAEESLLFGDLLMIKSYIIGWRLPAGISTIMLKVRRAEDELVGNVSWYDRDTAQIETSKLILVRKSSRDYVLLLERAKNEMEGMLEGADFRRRKSVEAS
jgi:hypothetical protein